jgi:membrane protein DedA with SNARE-associated domain
MTATANALRRMAWWQVALAAAALAATIAVATGQVGLPDTNKLVTDLSDSLGAWTYGLVAALAFLETGAFIGLLAPGETAVVLGGVVAARGEVELVALLAIVWAAAALGDLASYLLGRRLGPGFLTAHGGRLGVTPERLTRVEGFVQRHGPKAVLVGRFVGLVRAVAPFLAGATGLEPRRFIPWSLLGTLAWSALFTLVGYVFWRSFASAADTVTHAALGAAVLAAAVLFARAHLRGRRERLVVQVEPCR